MSAMADHQNNNNTAASSSVLPWWEWCSDGLQWIPYTGPCSASLEAAFAAGLPHARLRISHASYVVSFQPRGPCQRNLTTGRTRPVRRQLTVQGSRAVWEWHSEERQEWHAYESRLGAQIEVHWTQCNVSKTTSRQNGPAGFFFRSCGQDYAIEFETDAVQFNAKTSFSRGVRRRLCFNQTGSLAEGSTANTCLGGVTNNQGVGVASVSIRSQCANYINSDPSSSNSLLLNGTIAFSNSQQTGQSGVWEGAQCTHGSVEEPSYDVEDLVDYPSPLENEDCSICLSGLLESTAVVLSKCKHSFHRGCLESWFNSRPTCPECLTVYGTIFGTQPPGKMQVNYIAYGSSEARSGLAGYQGTDVIKITYIFPSGIQTAEHPNPGKPYSGTTRVAYLPKNKDGEEVLELLKKAWSRRLLFRVGTSVTTGQNNVVTWSTIHHKTCKSGGSSNHGYPDESYFSRVKQELADAGIT